MRERDAGFQRWISGIADEVKVTVNVIETFNGPLNRAERRECGGKLAIYISPR